MSRLWWRDTPAISGAADRLLGTGRHRIGTGAVLADDPLARTAWYGLYGSVSALVLRYRVLTPLRLNPRHRMRVEG
ncbi:putative protein OS=Streptomyces fumanus OX=67302 GN=GCM10018772_47130 PE=4 SV=1 [Streptomyces fumanus]